MPGGNPPRAPQPSSSSAHSNHGKPRWNSSSAAAAQISKPSPNSSAIPSNPIPIPNNRDPNKRPQHAKPDGPSPRPDNPVSISDPPRPVPVLPFLEPPPPPTYGFQMLKRRTIVLMDGSERSYLALPPDYENVTLMPRPAFRPEFRGPHGFGLDRPPFPMSPEFLGPGPDARPRNNPEHWNSGPESRLKRKFMEEERAGRDDGFERQRQQLLQYGNAHAPGPSGVHDLGRGEEERAPKTKSLRMFHGNAGKLKHTEIDQNALKKAFFHFVKLVYESTQQRKKYLADGKQGPLGCLACGR